MPQTTDENATSDSIDETPTEPETRLPIRHILTSVMAAAIGVQNKKNQEKDFNAKGSIYIYIAAGVIFTALFVVTVSLVVTTVLKNAT